MRRIFSFLYKLAGWRISGDVPRHLNKALWAVTPHWRTSDFFIGIGGRAALNIPTIGFLGKHTLFKWYSAWFFKALKGYPVNRSKSTNLVEAVAKTFGRYEKIGVAIAPEGTRKNVDKLKSGFYFMALAASVPIITVSFDYSRKCIEIGPIIYPTGDYVKDMKPFYDYFASLDTPKKDWLKKYIETGIIPTPGVR
jgi:1-acyl-sn-glycerol-3-phosphate acyltransferase